MTVTQFDGYAVDRRVVRRQQVRGVPFKVVKDTYTYEDGETEEFWMVVEVRQLDGDLEVDGSDFDHEPTRAEVYDVAACWLQEADSDMCQPFHPTGEFEAGEWSLYGYS